MVENACRMSLVAGQKTSDFGAEFGVGQVQQGLDCLEGVGVADALFCGVSEQLMPSLFAAFGAAGLGT